MVYNGRGQWHLQKRKYEQLNILLKKFVMSNVKVFATQDGWPDSQPDEHNRSLRSNVTRLGKKKTNQQNDKQKSSCCE